MDANLLSVIVKVITAILGTVATAAIGYGIYYFKKKNPKGFTEFVVAAHTVISIVVNYLKANNDVKQEVQVIYDLFVENIVKLIPGITADEINALFDSVIDEIASALGLDITAFATSRITKITKVTK